MPLVVSAIGEERGMSTFVILRLYLFSSLHVDSVSSRLCKLMPLTSSVHSERDPDSVGSTTSAGSSTGTEDHAGGDGNAEADKFDAKLEKRRKHRADMKRNTW